MSVFDERESEEPQSDPSRSVFDPLPVQNSALPMAASQFINPKPNALGTPGWTSTRRQRHEQLSQQSGASRQSQKQSGNQSFEPRGYRFQGQQQSALPSYSQSNQAAPADTNHQNAGNSAGQAGVKSDGSWRRRTARISSNGGVSGHFVTGEQFAGASDPKLVRRNGRGVQNAMRKETNWATRPPRAVSRHSASRRGSAGGVNFWIRTCVLVVALGIALILIITSMPRANEVAARNYDLQPESQLKWKIVPLTPEEDKTKKVAIMPVALQVTGAVPSGHNGKPVPENGGGQLTAVPGTWLGNGKGHVYYYRLEIESGVPVDPQTAAKSVHMILNDPRGWGGPNGEISFTRTDGHADFRIVIATPRLVDSLCAPLTTRGQVSCRNGSNVVLNANKWIYGAKMWPQMGKTLDEYRIYQVSHETGHWLGHGHVSCPGRGALAPTMKQQSADSGQNDGCIPNGWPNPSVLGKK